jgi:prevent-host-death family protein
MKRMSVQELKAHLSGAIAEAESGSTVLITRHNEPVAQLVPASPRHVRRGARVGMGPIKPAISRGTRGRYLAVLLEDRGGR